MTLIQQNMSVENPFQPNIVPTTPIALSPVAYRTVQVLRQQGKLSRTHIADTIGYSPSKITGVINQLLESGIVEEQTHSSTYTGGRRAIDLFFKPDFGYFLAVTIDSDKLDIALIDFAEQTRVRRMLPIASNAQPSTILQSMTDFVLERLDRFAIPLDKLLGVGISLSGAINHTSGTPYNSSDLPGWGGYQIVSFIREIFPHAIVRVEKDANAMAFAELRKGRAKSIEHLIYLQVGQGIRAGFILNGKIYRGMNGRAGDIDDVLQADGQPLQSLSNVLDTIDTSNEKSLAKVALEGNTEALQHIETCGKSIGRVLATMTNLLDPQLILIGGNASNLGHPFLAAIRRSILDYSHSSSTEHLQVELAPLGAEASLVGMTALIAEQIFVAER